jgi:peptidoglycan hydrolase-like protein with peptidoglycan-binding domain
MMPVIRLGSLGESVKTLQAALNLWSARNESRLVIDGFFGLSTNSKVREYQRANELAPDGVVGPVTWESLEPLVDHVVATMPVTTSELEAGARIVLAHANAAPAAAPSAPRGRSGSSRAWTATPSARRDARYRRARSA